MGTEVNLSECAITQEFRCYPLGEANCRLIGRLGDVAFTTKSRTEQFHGCAFESFQSDVLDPLIYGHPSKAPKTFAGSLRGSVGAS